MPGVEEFRVLDINSTWLGVGVEELMENAGRAVAEVLGERTDLEGRRVLVLCGTGNNGGDGLVAARYLLEAGARVSVVLLGEPKSDAARGNLAKLRRLGVKVRRSFERLDAEIVVDALLGTGVRGEVREPYRRAIEAINGSRAFKVSVDVPSGLNERGEGYCVAADLVVTFHAPKPGLERFPTVVVDIGIPQEASRCVGPGDVVVRLPKRRREAHKGEHGRVLVVGGSAEYHGAPLLSARAALRSGVDLVYLAVPEVNFEVTRGFSPEFIVRKYPGERFSARAIPEVEPLLEKVDSVVLGPGLGVVEETLEAVVEFLNLCQKPCVVDADAIKALRDRLPLKGARLVLTPHAGEFYALTGERLPQEPEARAEAAAEWASELGAVLLVKGSVDVIASPDGEVRLNRTGNPAMTAGGTGDVLSGIVAGLIARGMRRFDAACCAAFINGYAGDLLTEERRSLTALELADAIPHAIKDIFERFGRI
ncbi:MAG: NAD(P)H-hydrate dehydratase [Euryarchaeota archaeon]|nr:NAD(P)H-hydrate dehydratase [Euryarchaeota archaeon]